MKIVEIRCVDPKPRLVAGDTKIFVGGRYVGSGSASFNMTPDRDFQDHNRHLHVSMLAEQLISRDATRAIGFTSPS